MIGKDMNVKQSLSDGEFSNHYMSSRCSKKDPTEVFAKFIFLANKYLKNIVQHLFATLEKKNFR